MSSTTDSHAVSYLVGNQDELVYDYLISLGAEIQLVWKAPWKLGKFLYFLTRYLAFAGAVVKVFLNEGRFLSLGTCNVLSKTMSLILFLRVWAIWGNSRKIAGLLVIGFLIPAPIVSICVLLRAPKSQNNSDFYESVLHNKFGLCPPFLIDSNGIIVMFAYLAVYEAGQSGSHTSFVYKFFLDGLTYNIVALISSAANIIIRTTVSGGYTALFLDLQATMHSILTSRMLLHIRQETMDTALSATQFSQSLHFASGPLNDVPWQQLEKAKNLGRRMSDSIQAGVGVGVKSESGSGSGSGFGSGFGEYHDLFNNSDLGAVSITPGGGVVTLGGGGGGGSPSTSSPSTSSPSTSIGGEEDRDQNLGLEEGSGRLEVHLYWSIRNVPDISSSL
ncbi:hypothetical protein K435DRAFT_792899 [Dendrothele bispora CBS 962.96]|uniref:DUF6533 domain-containing protein n=1 Tax=Dendrothele bispora (strain CBS 962.96) TaxID=1314807 RepID=A0A4S8MHG6_DENBC|nr:hypothetical protein K435DRAFT_792899 [Dendrothele bispora CBS 962.96]